MEAQSRRRRSTRRTSHTDRYVQIDLKTMITASSRADTLQQEPSRIAPAWNSGAGGSRKGQLELSDSCAAAGVASYSAVVPGCKTSRV
ncbi:hypothetical protein VUR80DRAFT_4895 [Thermomyces stellatus]